MFTFYFWVVYFVPVFQMRSIKACMFLLRFMWRHILVHALESTLLIHILSLSQMEITLQSSLPNHPSSLTSTGDMKAMAFLGSLSSVISAWMEKKLPLAPQMDAFTFTTPNPLSLWKKSRRMNNLAWMLLSILSCLMWLLHVVGMEMSRYSSEIAVFKPIWLYSISGKPVLSKI